MLNWDEGLHISVGDLISSSGDLGSSSTLHQHIKELFETGFIDYQGHPDDGRIKVPFPSEATIKYYEELAQYTTKCFESQSLNSSDVPAYLSSSGLLSQAYLQAQAEALKAYSLAEKQIAASETLSQLTQGVCEAITAQPLYLCAWIGFSSTALSRAIEMASVAGVAKAYGETLKLSWDPNSVYGCGPTGIAIRSGRSVVMSDTEMTTNFGPWVESTRRYGIRSAISTPLISKSKALGILIVYAKEPYSFGPTEIFLFEKLGSQIVNAIDAVLNKS